MDDENAEELFESQRNGRIVASSFEHPEISQDQVNDFVGRIFGIPWAMVSEHSEIADFCSPDWIAEGEPRPEDWVTVDEAYERIYREYGLRLRQETHSTVLSVLHAVGIGASRQ